MRVFVLASVLLFTSCLAASLETRQNTTGLADVPQCAQTCLSNSTAIQGTCSDLDIKCLCANQEYVNSLSCCLATNCDASDQSKAIAFNQQECASVGETAPGFVGCSPFSLSSFVGLGSSATAMPPSTLISAPATTTTSGPNPLVSTVLGSTDSDFGWESIVGEHATTVAFTQRPILTGSCTVPNFALETNAANMSFLYPEIGCSDLRADCCPYNPHIFAVLPECPVDYYTTSSACCPFGFQLLTTAIGYVTPCFSYPSVTLVPATTPSISGLTLITGMVFARKYLLTDPTLPDKTTSGGLTKGAIVGISLGIANAVLFAVLLFFWMRRRAQRRKQAEEARKVTFRPRTQEMDEPHDITRPSELDPQSHPVTPHTALSRSTGDWPMGPVSPPPTYNSSAASAGMKPPPAKAMSPQELPGSTFIYEHHPAFDPERSDQATTSPPSIASEPRTPGASEPPRTPTKSQAAEPVHSPPAAISPMMTPTK